MNSRGQQHARRIRAWAAGRDYVAIGNLGEQVTVRLLVDAGYLLLAAQDDLVGGVGNILERTAHENPEDFIAVDPEGRLVTVNSKASFGRSSCRLTKGGHLTAPRLGKGQGGVDYYSMRAELISPLEGGLAFGQVVKVDLVHELAQFFEIEPSGRLTAIADPIDVGAMIEEVMAEHGGRIPPPRTEDWT